MQNRIFIVAIIMVLTGSLVTPARAQDKNGNDTQISINSNGKHVYQIKNNWHELSFEMKGDIELNESDTEVVSISRGGYLELVEKKPGRQHRLRIEGLTGGRLSYSYKRNRRNVDFADIDRDWYERMLITMIRETGAGAEKRTARILRTDGVAGVFDEIEQIESSGSRVRYMTYLMEQAKLNDVQLQRAAKMAAGISSSGDRSRVLRESAAHFLASDAAVPYYFDAVESIPSSGDKTRVLTYLVQEDLLNGRDRYLEAIRVSQSIPSSGDRSRFLMDAAGLYIAEASDVYFDALTTIPSSGDKTRVLLKLIEEDVLEAGSSLERAFKVAETIPSSGDRARFLIAAGPMYHAGARTAYFKAVDTLPSSGDHARVLTNLAKEVALNEASMCAYLQSAKGIASSGDKARVLLAVAEDVAGNDDLVDVYLEAADTIGSSSDYKRVLSALMD